MLADENSCLFSDECKTKDDLVLGNGNMLVYLKNTDILSFHAGEYTTPSFLTLECDFYSEEFSCRSARKRDTSTYVHRLYEYGGVNKVRKFTKSIEDARIVDVMHPSSQTFVRYCENIIIFSYNHYYSPSYVNTAFEETYLDYVNNGYVVETECPTIPQKLADNEGVLTWEESEDNIGISHYIVYRNKKAVAYVEAGSELQYVIDKEGTYSVEAVDAAGNVSERGYF